MLLMPVLVLVLTWPNSMFAKADNPYWLDVDNGNGEVFGVYLMDSNRDYRFSLAGYSANITYMPVEDSSLSADIKNQYPGYQWVMLQVLPMEGALEYDDDEEYTLGISIPDILDGFGEAKKYRDTTDADRANGIDTLYVIDTAEYYYGSKDILIKTNKWKMINGFQVYAIVHLAKNTPFVEPEYDSEVTIRSWNDEFWWRMREHMPNFVSNPQEEYVGYANGIKINYVISPNEGDNYQVCLDAALKNSQEDVDLFLVEGDYAKKYCTSGIAKPFSSVGITSEDMKNQYQYTKDIVTNQGEVYGSSWQACIGGLIYNRDIAKKVLGSDDPAVVQQAVTDWDSYYNTALRMKTAGYKMTASVYDTYRTYYDNINSPMVQNGYLNVDANLESWAKSSKSLLENGCTGTCDLWYDEWNAGLRKTSNVFCYFGPAWLFNFCMGAGEESYVAYDGGWAICEGPQSFYWGGSWICIADKADNVSAAVYIIKKMTMDDSVLKEMCELDMDTVNSKSVNSQLANDSCYGNEVLGGQNPYGVFNSAGLKLKANNTTYYDYCNYSNGLNNLFQDAMKGYFNGNASYDEALEDYYSAVEARYPELKRPNEIKPILQLEQVDGGININWNAIEGAAKYRIYRKTPSGKWSVIKTTTALSYKDINVEYGTEYIYGVRCVGADGSYLNEVEECGRILYENKTPIITLAQADGVIQISWNAISGAAKYRVYKKKTGGKWSVIKTTTALSYKDTNVENGTEYIYGIRCVGADGNYLNNVEESGRILFAE